MGILLKISLLNSLQQSRLAVNRAMVTASPFLTMKKLLVASPVLFLVHPVVASESGKAEVPAPLVAVAAVEEPSLVEVACDTGADEQTDDARVLALRLDLQEITASLEDTRRAVDTVAEQRDDAREEVGVLTMANHEMRREMKVLREAMEQARREAESWKAQAEKGEERPAAGPDIRAEMGKIMEEFRVMKEDLALVRQELSDPVERANLKEQLVESRAREEQLEEEVEMALRARDKAIQEAADNRKDLKSRIAVLNKESRETEDLRDQLRFSRAGQMKALVDVEVLKKSLGRAEELQSRTLADLQRARQSVEALQAEKTATAESRMLAHRERDLARAEADGLRGQVEGVRIEVERSRKTVTQLAEELEETELARQANHRDLEKASGALEQSQAEVSLLSRAKGGLEELLFRKSAEVRKLRAELRGVHASAGISESEDSDRETGSGEEAGNESPPDRE